MRILGIVALGAGLGGGLIEPDHARLGPFWIIRRFYILDVARGAASKTDDEASALPSLQLSRNLQRKSRLERRAAFRGPHGPTASLAPQSKAGS